MNYPLPKIVLQSEVIYMTKQYNTDIGQIREPITNPRQIKDNLRFLLTLLTISPCSSMSSRSTRSASVLKSEANNRVRVTSNQITNKPSHIFRTPV